MTLNLNVTPYFDDYDINKGYLKILFKPGNSIQARELTQMQSLLQQQIRNLSDHFFKEGAMVIPGQAATDVNAQYCKVMLPTTLQSATDFVGKIVQGNKTGLKALVVKHVDIVDGNSDGDFTDYVADGDEPTTLYLKYLDGAPKPATTVNTGSGLILIENTVPGQTTFEVNGESITIDEGATATFVEGETLVTTATDGSNLLCEVMSNSVVANPIGRGSIGFIEEGVYYIGGQLVKCHSQSIVLSKYTPNPSLKIGLEISETVVTSNDDYSLLDTSLGSPNYNAPGADRLKVVLTLIKKDIDVIDTSNFVELITVKDGVVAKEAARDEYQSLMKTLARRTYDESGDYTVRPFKLDIREYYNENQNNGVFNMSDFVFDTDADARWWAESKMSDEYGMVIDGVGRSHQITTQDIKNYPDQVLDDTQTKYYPGLTHENLMTAVRNKIAIGIESGKAYVKGYEIEPKALTKEGKFLIYDKAREIYKENNEFIPVDLGSFVYVSDLKGLPKIDSSVNLVNCHISSNAAQKWISVPSDSADSTLNIAGISVDGVSAEIPTNMFVDGGTTLGSNTFGLDIVGTAKVKAISYFEDSSSSAKINNYSTANFRPVLVSDETAIYKLYLYDIEFEINPRTNVEYNMGNIRSITSQETHGSDKYYNFGANILQKLSLMQTNGTFTRKSMIYEKDNDAIRGITYHYNSLNGLLLVKPLNSGNAGGTNGFVGSATILPRESFSLNVVILEAVGVSSGNGDFANSGNATDTTILNTGVGGRLFSKSLLTSSDGSSIIDTGNTWVQTIRNIDDVSGNATVDTQYSVIKEFIGESSNSAGVIELSLPAGSPLYFENKPTFYNCWNEPTPSISAATIGAPQGFTFSADLKTVSFTATGLPVNQTGLITVSAPVRKTESKEKVKTETRKIYMPYSLTNLTGGSIVGQNWNAIVATNDSNDSTTYDVDIAGSRKTSSGTILPTLTGLGVSGTLELSVSEFQLHRSDIIELETLYDTCNVNNHAYRVAIDSADKKNIHQMSLEDFAFALKAYNFYEQTGTSPFNIVLQNVSNTQTYAGVEAQLTIGGVKNPFSTEILTLFVAGVSAIPNPADVPIKINDLTERYRLDTGAKDNVYGLGKIELISGSVPCGGRPIIIYKYWSHGVGDYASVDSYTEYADIGYNDSKRLSDVLDFRPPMIASSLDAAGWVLDGGWPYVLGVSDGQSREYPQTGTAISADMRAYLGRRDKLYVMPNGKFEIKYGSSSDNPQMPDDPTDGMVIYELSTEPYTIGPQAISVSMKDNRRYTMRDIGKLDKRISNLEYYTSLNLLEKDTLDMSITDGDGNDRFKNGFIVDQFQNHSVGATADPDYRVSIDGDEGELRPFHTSKSVNLSINSLESNGYALKEQKIYLPYTSEQIMAQEKSSKTINVNPFAIFSFRGFLNLFPATDDWKDTNQAPDIVTDKRDEYEVFEHLLPKDGVMGTVWGEWENNWTGVEETSRTVTRNSWSQDRDYKMARPNLRGVRGVPKTWTTTINQKKVGTRTRTGQQTTVAPLDKRESYGTKTLKTEMVPFMRSRNVYFSAERMKPNTRLYAYFDGVDVSSFCESTRKFTVTDVNSVISAWFSTNRSVIIDNRGKIVLRGDVSGHEVNLYDVDWIDSSTITLHVGPDNVVAQYGSRDGSFTVDEQLTVSWPDPNTATGFSEKRVGTLPTGNNLIAANPNLVTDDAGFISGIFSIPNTDNIKFKTGERIFRMSDQMNNASDADTECQTTYSATGIIETVADQIVLTRVPEFTVSDISSEEPIEKRINPNTSVQMRGGWYDPLAQTIMVDLDGGAFITAVDLFFSTKDDFKPVTCQLRHTVNGYPGPKIMGEKVVYPRDVRISDDGTLPTQFIFPSPIFCADQTEYCIVILADTQGYRTHISRMGQEAVDGSGIISAQPHAGVFFKSQNASTWTADQMEDLKFRVHRAVFDTSARGEIIVENTEYDDNNNDLWTQEFGQQSMKITENSSKITFDVGDTAGFVATDRWSAQGYNYVTISDIYGTYDVFPSESLNGDHLVTETTYNSFTIDLRNQFYATGSESQSIAYTGAELPGTTNLYTPKSNSSFAPRYKSNFKYDLMKPTIQTIEMPKTTITTQFRGLSGTSQDGGNLPGKKDPNYQYFVANKNITFSSPKMMATSTNERLFNTSGTALDKKSLVIKLNMFSEENNVSPVVDTQRMSAILISNKTNSPQDTTAGQAGYVNSGFIPETKNTGGSAATKYITKEVTLDQESSSLRVIAGVCRQSPCDIDFYYRIKTSAEQIFSTRPWIEMDRPDVYSKNSINSSDFREYEFDLQNLPEFTSVAVKIVLKTTNSSIVPKIKDLRIIALAS
jgi:hypothetical protein